jgi:hypothetical protein
MKVKKIKRPRVTKRPARTKAEKGERIRKIFRVASRVVAGFVKIWITVKGDTIPSKYIVAVEQVDELVNVLMHEGKTSVTFEQAE